MAQTIRKRLDGNLPEFLKDVGQLGRWEAMDKWGLEKSYLSVSKIILEETGNENYGLDLAGNLYGREGIKGVIQQFVAAFADYAIRKDKENRMLKIRLEAHNSEAKKFERDLAGELSEMIMVLRQ